MELEKVLKELSGFESIASFMVLINGGEGQMHVQKGGDFYSQIGMLRFIENKLHDSFNKLQDKGSNETPAQPVS